jgi:hypothetical protein
MDYGLNTSAGRARIGLDTSAALEMMLQHYQVQILKTNLTMLTLKTDHIDEN